MIVATTTMEGYALPKNATSHELTDKYLLLDSEYASVKEDIKEFTRKALY